MNFVTFPVNATNIFPIANSTAGGQLLSEYNLRSRESVATDEKIRYLCGPSYVHSERDFLVTNYLDDVGHTISDTAICISEGVGLINGHFVETFVPMIIDLAEANNKLREEGKDPLKGRLCVGLKAMYSDLPTMAGTIMVENENSMYEGIQVVILPEDQFVLPADDKGAESRAYVTADILLATFTYSNGKVKQIVNNYPEKCKSIPASRIADTDQFLSDVYITKTGMDSNRLYVFSSKGGQKDSDGKVVKDTWCDATGTLGVWNTAEKLQLVTKKPSERSAMFARSADGSGVVLAIPHKQVDGGLTNQNGAPIYYPTTYLPLPEASYDANTSGIVTPSYTRRVKEISEKINNFYRLPNGKQVGYIDFLESTEDLPLVSSEWKPGDYILVRQDATISYSGGTAVSYPSTMYVVMPGKVTQIGQYLGSSEDANKLPTSSTIRGIGIGGTLQTTYSYEEWNSELSKTFGNSDDAKAYRNTLFGIDDNSELIGTTDDYVVWINTEDKDTDDPNNDLITKYFYFSIEAATPSSKYGVMLLTGNIPFATEDVIGGFLNVDASSIDVEDRGYIYRDENGHLRLVDYTLLRAGEVGYQLGDDFETSSSLDMTAQQEELDEYVNNRIAFPNATKVARCQSEKDEARKSGVTDSSELIGPGYDANIIEITLNLPNESSADNPQELNIYGIDSRFGASIYLHIRGEANQYTTINLLNCTKVRIDSSISGNPTINVHKSCLYYDAAVINRLNSVTDTTLWYEAYNTSSSIQLEGMTVKMTTAPSEYIDDAGIDEVDYWSESADNDNHFAVSLHSITFDNTLHIVGCDLALMNSSTANLSDEDYILGRQFNIPQTSALPYPETRLNNAIKVEGSFISHYPSNDQTPYHTVLDTHVVAMTNAYSNADEQSIPGSIAFFVKVHHVYNIEGNVSNIDGWMAKSWHILRGGIV